MNNKKVLAIATACLLPLTGLTILVGRNNLNPSNVINVQATECIHHEGNHYLAKPATMDESGWVEFWACCKCGHQYIGVAPDGDWTTADPSKMIGVINEGHIAYVPPLTSGGTDGDYWGKDPF